MVHKEQCLMFTETYLLNTVSIFPETVLGNVTNKDMDAFSAMKKC